MAISPISLPSVWSRFKSYDKVNDVSTSISDTQFTLIRTYVRKLPQLDWFKTPTLVTDIVLRYVNRHYILYANIVLRPYLKNKWERRVEAVYSGLVEITSDEANRLGLEDVELVKDKYGASFRYEGDDFDEHCLRYESSYDHLPPTT